MKKEIHEGEFNEGLPWIYHRPYVGTAESRNLQEPPQLPCRHATWNGEQYPVYGGPDMHLFEYRREYTLAEVAQCRNEAGYNCTMLCLLCADEARTVEVRVSDAHGNTETVHWPLKIQPANKSEVL